MSDDESENQERRAHHNALERKRRDEIKECFRELRDSIPSMRGKSHTRSHVLKRTKNYIKTIRKKTKECEDDIEALERQNKLLMGNIVTVSNSLREKKIDFLAQGGVLPKGEEEVGEVLDMETLTSFYSESAGASCSGSGVSYSGSGSESDGSDL